MKVILYRAPTFKHVLKPVLLFAVLAFAVLTKIEGKFPFFLLGVLILLNIASTIIYFRYRQIAIAENNVMVVKGFGKTITLDIDTIDLVKIESDFLCKLHNIKKLVFTVNGRQTKVYTPDFTLPDFEVFFRNAIPGLLPYRKERDIILN